jgi:putative two-component system response regulator
MVEFFLESDAIMQINETVPAYFSRLPAPVRHHCLVTGQYMRIILREMNLGGIESELTWQGLSPFDYHDIGKILLPKGLLCQRWLYSGDQELKSMGHVDYGQQIFADLRLEEPGAEGFCRAGEQITLFHHECYDGSGYPDGRTGKAIPFLARVCAVANAYDGLRQGFGIFPPLHARQALEQLEKQAGTWFDPAVVEAFGAWVKASPDAGGESVSRK